MVKYQCTLHFPLVLMGYICSFQGPALSLFRCLLCSTPTFFTFPWSFCLFFFGYFLFVFFFFFQIIILYYFVYHPVIEIPLLTYLFLLYLIYFLKPWPHLLKSSHIRTWTGGHRHRILFFLKAILWFLVQLSCFKASEYDYECITPKDLHTTDSQPNSTTQISVLTKLIFKYCCCYLTFLHRWNLLAPFFTVSFFTSRNMILLPYCLQKLIPPLLHNASIFLEMHL